MMEIVTTTVIYMSLFSDVDLTFLVGGTETDEEIIEDEDADNGDDNICLLCSIA